MTKGHLFVSRLPRTVKIFEEEEKKKKKWKTKHDQQVDDDHLLLACPCVSIKERF